MDGMMIHDLTGAADAAMKSPGCIRTGKSVLQFCQVLGENSRSAQAQDPISAAEIMTPEEPVSAEMTPEPGETSLPESRSQEMAAPFFSAALFDQSASLIEPSENARHVRAAERVQELVGQWLKAQRTEEATGPELVQSEEQLAAEELVALAFDLLNRGTDDPEEGSAAVAAGQAVPLTGEETIQPVLPIGDEAEAVHQGLSTDAAEGVQPAAESFPLNDEELKELRQLMAVMLQRGRASEAMENPRPKEVVGRQLKGMNQFGEGNRAVKSDASEAAGIGTEDQPAKAQGKTPEEAGVPQAVSVAAGGGLQEKQLTQLLRPRAEKAPLQQTQAVRPEAPPVAEENLEMVEPSTETVAIKADVAETEGVKPAVGQPQVQPITQGAETAIRPQQQPQVETVAARVMQLPSGQRLPESQLVDQVVTHLAGSHDGESGRMRLRLHPAELGSLRLDLIVEGDRVRAHLQAQSQQVQDVLDRHLPQLRDALHQQGLKIDEFRVDVQGGKEQHQEQQFAHQRGDQNRTTAGPWLNDDWPQPELEIPLAQLLEPSSGGISLHV